MSKNWKGLYRLLQRYQDGTINPIKKQVVDFWYDSLGTNDTHAVDDLAEDQQLKMQIWNAVKLGMTGHQEISEPVIVNKWWQSVYVKLAAACIILFAGFIIYKANPSNQYAVIANVPNAVIEELVSNTNQSGQVKIITLEDGSQVSLDPDATLYYPQKFAAGERKVFLKGNAFFNVTKNRSKPFMVYADHIVTKVLGTSFTIKKLAQGSIEVAVVTGTVKVKNNTENAAGSLQTNEVTLTRNKKVTFFPGNEVMLPGLVDQPLLGHQEESGKEEPGSFNFLDKSVSEILPQLEKAYGVKIIAGNKNLENCSITADVSHFKDLFAQLDIICAAIGASYEVKADTVVLTGSGCKLDK